MDISNIYDAKEVLKDVISKTPLVHADKLHENLWIKAENLQGTGAFKLRGAYHKLHSLTQKEREKGVIAASAGNHAQGVAYSCMKMGIKGTIVMPKTAPLSKIEATRSYGVAVELQGDTFNDAYEYAKNLQEITGAVFVEPFDDEYVIAGQGTIGLEILDKLSDVDTVIVPIAGRSDQRDRRCNQGNASQLPYYRRTVRACAEHEAVAGKEGDYQAAECKYDRGWNRCKNSGKADL